MRAAAQTLEPDLAWIDSAAERGAAALFRAQQADGSWEGECVWCPMLTAQYVMTAHVIGLEIPSTRRERILLHFRSTQHDSGLWGLHPLDEGSLFVTALVYVAARLLGVPRGAAWLQPARRLFASEGRVQAIPTWGKVWLAVLGLYGWNGINPILPEAWLLPSRLPIHPAHFYCHTRSIYMGLAVLYAERLTAAPHPTLDALRAELYLGRYSEIDFSAHANDVRIEDAPFRPTRALRVVYALSRAYEGLGLSAVRRRALERLRGRMRAHLRASDHLSLSPVNGLLSVLALWRSSPGDPDLAKAIERLDAWFWEDDREGARMAGAGSVCWDTAFALQAAASIASGLYEEPTRRGAEFLASQQVELPQFDFEEAYRIGPTGGWCFSAVGHGWPVSDCTAEALLALLETHPEELGREGAARAVRFILRCQNEDGGFGSYEPRKTTLSLEWMNPSEMFGGCMTERSYVECTASCLIALSSIRRRYPDLLRIELQTALDGGKRFLTNGQGSDGTWPGAWGVHFIYGTMFGVRGLLAAGVAPDDQRIRRACRWLLAHQRADGGWGEHHRSARLGRHVGQAHGSPVQTAWALIALVEAEEPDSAALFRAARFLEGTQEQSGEWPDGEFVGVFFETALLNYRLYRLYFPVCALGRLHEHLTRHSRSESNDARNRPTHDLRASA